MQHLMVVDRAGELWLTEHEENHRVILDIPGVMVTTNCLPIYIGRAYDEEDLPPIPTADTNCCQLLALIYTGIKQGLAPCAIKHGYNTYAKCMYLVRCILATMVDLRNCHTGCEIAKGCAVYARICRLLTSIEYLPFVEDIQKNVDFCLLSWLGK